MQGLGTHWGGPLPSLGPPSSQVGLAGGTVNVLSFPCSYSAVVIPLAKKRVLSPQLPEGPSQLQNDPWPRGWRVNWKEVYLAEDVVWARGRGGEPGPCRGSGEDMGDTAGQTHPLGTSCW